MSIPPTDSSGPLSEGVPLRCRCGTIQGTLVHPHSANHALCYCHDCQAFAHVLGQADRTLGPQGESRVFQVPPRNLTFTQGHAALACLRLTPKGMVRWYAGCCSTPIGNTLPTPKLSFIGLVRPFVALDDGALVEAFGPITTWANTAGAHGSPRPRQAGTAHMLAWFFRTVLPAWINGEYKRTPFFDPATGAPVVTPRVLSPQEHAAVMQRVRQGPATT